MRKIKLIKSATPSVDGAGVHLMRVFGNREAELFDPFLMLDDFRNDRPEDYLAGFPWHPHRGIETITYMLEGSAEHGDSLGNKGVIAKGDVQWMTAGSGIIHQEMPKPGKDGKMYGFQLWANLPAREKMTKPRYRDIKAGEIPQVSSSGALVKVICGEYNGVRGPVEDIRIAPVYLDVSLEPDTDFVLDTSSGNTCFLYCYDGSGFSDDREVRDHQIVLFEDGEAISVLSGKQGLSFLFLSGKPLHEPIAWGGPIVMNTREELRQAFAELEKGTFIRK